MCRSYSDKTVYHSDAVLGMVTFESVRIWCATSYTPGIPKEVSVTLHVRHTQGIHKKTREKQCMNDTNGGFYCAGICSLEPVGMMVKRDQDELRRGDAPAHVAPSSIIAIEPT